MKSQFNKLISSALLASALILGASPTARADGDRDRNPQVLPPNSRPYGKSYSQWSAKWWQWFLEHPVAGHPGVDSPDFDVRSGQEGKVWFLATPTGTVERSIRIPNGKAIFIALLNAEASSLEEFPFFGATEEAQREAAEWFMDHVVNISCSVDGKLVRQIHRYRVQSPQFSFTAPTPWVFGATGGEGTAVADGYYVMLAPLSSGPHTVHVEGLFRFSEAEGDPFTADIPLDVTYHINVGPASVVPADERYHGKTYSEWSAKSAEMVLELPLAGHPSLDTNPNFDASYGQRGNVWFLGAPFGTLERTVTVSADKALFFILLNAESSSLEPPESGFHGDTEAEQAEVAKWWSDHIVNSFFVVDNEPVQNIGDFRFVSPQYDFDAPTPWLFGETGGHGTSVADGYYVMLRPLSKGNHTVRLGGTFHFAAGELGPDPLDLTADMTYHITVTRGHGHDRNDDDCDRD